MLRPFIPRSMFIYKNYLDIFKTIWSSSWQKSRLSEDGTNSCYTHAVGILHEPDVQSLESDLELRRLWRRSYLWSCKKVALQIRRMKLVSQLWTIVIANIRHGHSLFLPERFEK